MSRDRIRRFLLAGVLIVLSLLMLGVSPTLQNLINQMAGLEAQVQNLESEKQVLQSRIGALEAESDSQPVVVDSSGTRVGTVLTSTGANAIVVIDEVDTELFSVRVSRDRLLPNGEPSFLLFGSPDCTGPPLLLPQPDSISPRPFIHLNRSDLPIYIPDRSPSSQVVVDVMSFIHENNDDCNFQNDPGLLVVPAVSVFIWQNEFTPPFRVVTRGEFLDM